MIALLQLGALLVAVIAGAACVRFGRGLARAAGLVPVAVWGLGYYLPRFVGPVDADDGSVQSVVAAIVGLQVAAAVVGLWLYNRFRMAHVARVADE